MVEFHISLSSETAEFVQAELAPQNLSPDEYFEQLAYRALAVKAKKELDAQLLEGLTGERIAITKEDMDTIWRDASAMFKNKRH